MASSGDKWVQFIAFAYGITLFVVKEKAKSGSDLNEIYKNQMILQKGVLTEEKLEDVNWKYTCCPYTCYEKETESSVLKIV